MTDDKIVTIEELLQARFPDADHKVRQGRGGMSFTYVEDEAVMQRLDDVLGFGMWSIHVTPIDVEKGIVKVALWVSPLEGRSGATFEDFGYCNNPNGEAPLKEAVTDGIRRVGRMAGVARYVYAGEAEPTAPTLSPKVEQFAKDGPINDKQRKYLFAKMHEALGANYSDDRAKLAVFMATGKRSTHQMTTHDLERVVESLKDSTFVEDVAQATAVPA